MPLRQRISSKPICFPVRALINFPCLSLVVIGELKFLHLRLAPEMFPAEIMIMSLVLLSNILFLDREVLDNQLCHILDHLHWLLEVEMFLETHEMLHH